MDQQDKYTPEGFALAIGSALPGVEQDEVTGWAKIADNRGLSFPAEISNVLGQREIPGALRSHFQQLDRR